PDRQPTSDPHPRPGLPRPFVHASMHHPALRREPILSPCAFHMNQSALSWTIQPMLQCRKRNELFLGIHGGDEDLFIKFSQSLPLLMEWQFDQSSPHSQRMTEVFPLHLFSQYLLHQKAYGLQLYP